MIKKLFTYLICLLMCITLIPFSNVEKISATSAVVKVDLKGGTASTIPDGWTEYEPGKFQKSFEVGTLLVDISAEWTTGDHILPPAGKVFDSWSLPIFDGTTTLSIEGTNFVAWWVDKTNYLTFTAKEANSSITFNYKEVNGNTTAAPGDLQYREYNNSTWTEWTDYTENTQINLVSIDDQVQFKGTNVITDNSNHFTMTGKISASGDVTSLTNGLGGDVALTENCYSYMFLECSSLIEVPELSSTGLEIMCYYAMFKGCTSLTGLPSNYLPALSLEGHCYQSMFEGCTSLVTPSSLPATTLADYCYANMFCGCIKLSTAPDLNVEDLTVACYMGMFDGCSSLTTAPEFNAKTLASKSCNAMFKDCIKLTTPIDMSNITTIGDDVQEYIMGIGIIPVGCCGSMYYGCENIYISEESDGLYNIPWTIPNLVTTSAPNWSESMFASTSGTFTASPTTNKTYYLMGTHTHDELIFNKTITNTSSILTSGNYCLTSDVILEDDIIIGTTETVTICLNGYVLDLNTHSITNNGTLNIYDCKGDEDHKHYYTIDNTTKLAELSNVEQTTYVLGGVITNGYKAIWNKKDLTINGVNFVGNGNAVDADIQSSVLYLDATDSNTNIYNCKFIGNSVAGSAAVIYISIRNNILIQNCIFKYNNANTASVIYNRGNIILINSEISNNTSLNSGAVYSKYQSSCLIEGTKVMMSDGSLKNIEDIVDGDIIKTYDHELGTISSSKVVTSYKGENKAKAFILHFSNDNELGIVDLHDLFCKEELKYVTITEENVNSYIGKHFYNAVDNRYEELLSVTYPNESYNYYSIYTANHFNCITNNMLSVPDDIDYLINIYKFNENLSIDHDQLDADILTYGLLDFEDCEFCPLDVYNNSNAKYIYIAIGKGLVDMNTLIKDMNYAKEYEDKNSQPIPILMMLGTPLLGDSNTLKTYSDYSGLFVNGIHVLIGSDTKIINNYTNGSLCNLFLTSNDCIGVIEDANNINVGITLDNDYSEDKVFAKGVYTNSLTNSFHSDNTSLVTLVKEGTNYDYYFGEYVAQPILLLDRPITFHNLEDIDILLPTTISFGTNIDISNIKPTKQGYIFDGFYRDNNYKYKVDTLVYNIVEEVWAKWIKYDLVNIDYLISDIEFNKEYTRDEAEKIIRSLADENTNVLVLVYGPYKAIKYYGYDKEVVDLELYGSYENLNSILYSYSDIVYFLGTPIKREGLTITYDLDGGTITSNDYSTSVEFLSNEFILPIVIKDGYTLDGYYLYGEKLDINDLPHIYRNITIYIKWIKNDIEPTLTDTFVSRLYACFLRHKKYGYNYTYALIDDPEGVAYWTNELDKGIQTGASITYNFYLSDEYQSILKNEYDNQLDRDSRFIKDLYRAMQGREAEDIGYNYWMNDLQSGQTYKQVIDNIARSIEFNNICKEYNIIAIKE